MRLGLVLAILAASVVTVVVLTSTVIDVIAKDEHAQSIAAEDDVQRVSCNAAVGPTTPENAESGAGQAGQLDDEQRGIVSEIVSIGQDRDLPSRAWQIAIQAGMTESRLRNLDYGDRDSLGIFQMRPSMGWGTRQQVTDVEYQINKFYDVMEDVPDWSERRPGEVAQAVERSAFPERYHDWEPMAVHLVENVGDVDDAGGCGPGGGDTIPPNERAETAIEFALEERGKPYVWGATGPDSYDCSGLLLRAYEAAGVTIPRVSRDQYNAGAKLSIDDAEPGDLLFWAYDQSDPSTIHHVAMYLGDGEMVEAQQSGVPVHTRSVEFDEPEILPVAVRPGT